MNPCIDQTDSALLSRYAEEGNEVAFAEVVRRHLGLVYAAALRQLDGDAHRAQDVSQAVFIELARQARKLRHHAVLTGWLYTTTHHLVQRQRRGDQRRADREREAHVMQELNRPSEPDWRELRSMLDEAMRDLREPDRLAVLLRYFEGSNLRAVAAALGVSEDAARMRVDRALDRLRAGLLRRGIHTTAAALVPALGTFAAEVIPAGLAGQIVTGALASVGAAAGSGGVLLTLQVPFALMKAPLVTASLAAVLVTAPLLYQHGQLTATRAELASLNDRIGDLDALRAADEQLRQRAAAAEELVRLRAEAAELARLRAEKTALRAALNHPLQIELARADDARATARAALRETIARAEFVVTRERTITAMKQLGLAARVHANEHQNELPRSFEEFADALAGQFPEFPRDTLDLYEFYPQPRVIGENEPGLFFLREKAPRRKPDGGWERAYGIVDGSVQTLTSSTADFTEVEQNARGIASP